MTSTPDGSHEHPHLTAYLEGQADALSDRLDGQSARIDGLAQRLAVVEAALEQPEPPAVDPEPTPPPDPEPTPPLTGPTVLAASPLRNVPVPLRRNSPYADVFHPGRAGDHVWGIGGYEAGHQAPGYHKPETTVTTGPEGWHVTYEKGLIRSMPVKLKRPVREAWACFRVHFADDWRFGRTTKLAGFIGPDGRTQFSARIIVWDWHQNGNTRTGVYVYHQDQGQGYGDENHTPYPIRPGDTIDYLMRVRLNDPAERNGEATVWVRPSAVDRTDPWTRVGHMGGLRWDSDAIIDSWYWHHMYGGDPFQWAPDDQPHSLYLTDFAAAERRNDLYPWARWVVQL